MIRKEKVQLRQCPFYERGDTDILSGLEPKQAQAVNMFEDGWSEEREMTISIIISLG